MQTELGDVVDQAYGLAIQRDGKLVVAGSGGLDDLALVRYLPDGRLDPRFGNGGIVFTDIAGAPDQATALAIQRDGKLVVAGTTGLDPSTGEADLLVARYRAGTRGNSPREPFPRQ